MGSICHRYMCIVLYISASRSAKFGVVVFKASLLKSKGGQSAIEPCHTVTPPLPIDHISMLHCYTPYVCPVYLCIMLYGQLEEGEGSVYHETDLV